MQEGEEDRQKEADQMFTAVQESQSFLCLPGSPLFCFLGNA